MAVELGHLVLHFSNFDDQFLIYSLKLMHLIHIEDLVKLDQVILEAIFDQLLNRSVEVTLTVL